MGRDDRTSERLRPAISVVTIFVGTLGFLAYLTLSGFLAFVLAISVAHGLAHLDASELLSFMLAMPLGTLAWFYGVGWFLITGGLGARYAVRRSCRLRSTVHMRLTSPGRITRHYEKVIKVKADVAAFRV